MLCAHFVRSLNDINNSLKKKCLFDVFVMVLHRKRRRVAALQQIVAGEQNGDALQEEINKAHVVCIVFSAEDKASLARITDFWLPLVRDAVNGPIDQRKPVVLVGNKLDLVEHSLIDVSIGQRLPASPNYAPTSLQTPTIVMPFYSVCRSSWGIFRKCKAAWNVQRKQCTT